MQKKFSHKYHNIHSVFMLTLNWVEMCDKIHTKFIIIHILANYLYIWEESKPVKYNSRVTFVYVPIKMEHIDG